MGTKPNIVYIFSDQHRGDSMGCVGHTAVITPNLDRLSDTGVTFTRCCTNSPLCMPARASMMTGQYVCEHGVWNNLAEADPKGPSHVRNIRDAGYHTALIGKTHLWIHDSWVRGDQYTHARDFIPIQNDWGFEDVHELHGPLASIRNDSEYTDYLAEKGLLEDHRNYQAEYYANWAAGKAKPWEEPPCPLPDEDHLDSYTGRKSVEWIKNYEGEKPFYLQVLFPGPHDPFDSPAHYREMYNPQDIPPAILNLPGDPQPLYVQGVLKWSGIQDITAEQSQILRSFYYGKITLIDDYIGKIMKALEEKGLTDNTWIVYNSDHGEMAGDHMMSHKIVFYEGALRIPCIFKPPGGIEGWQTRALSDHLDVAASLIDIAGGKPIEDSEGRSLLAQISAGPDAPDAQAGKEVVFSEVVGFTMARDDLHKLAVEAKTLNPVELFDCEQDPDELQNRVNDPALESTRSEMIDRYLKPHRRRLDEAKYNHFLETEAQRMKHGRGPLAGKKIQPQEEGKS